MFRRHTSIVFLASLCAAQAQAGMIGINVLLNTEASDEILADLEEHGQILDLIAEINAVTMKAQDSELPAIQALPFVAAASPDVMCQLAGGSGLPVPDLADGANQWSLDAINVTDFDTTRTVESTGEGVYVAVLDSGLPYNWREYFPEERIASQHARAFGGGGGEKGTISERPETWEHDTDGHGTLVTSVILGFAYSGPDEQLPSYFNGVSPKATVIPVRMGQANTGIWESVVAHAIVYVTNLKVSGALGAAPLVINYSGGAHEPLVMVRAAIDFAIANGVVVVAAAGNEAAAGMLNPAAYPEVISVAGAGWVGNFPPGDPTLVLWMLSDVAENEASEYFIAPNSSRELIGQDLDVTAPGWMIPVPWTVNGQVDYSFVEGTSFAAPHVAGVAALLLQNSPTLTQAQIAVILESTALSLPPACGNVTFPGLGPGNVPPTWDDLDNVFLFDATVCWESNATGHGLLQADAALEATSMP